MPFPLRKIRTPEAGDLIKIRPTKTPATRMYIHNPKQTQCTRFVGGSNDFHMVVIPETHETLLQQTPPHRQVSSSGGRAKVAQMLSKRMVALSHCFLACIPANSESNNVPRNGTAILGRRSVTGRTVTFSQEVRNLCHRRRAWRIRAHKVVCIACRTRSIGYYVKSKPRT